MFINAYDDGESSVSKISNTTDRKNSDRISRLRVRAEKSCPERCAFPILADVDAWPNIEAAVTMSNTWERNRRNKGGLFNIPRGEAGDNARERKL